MKFRVLGVIAGLLLFAAMAFAAGPMPDTINVTFPFPVVVNNLTLPPGSYQFKRANDNMPAYFKIFNSDGKELGMTTLSNREEVGTAGAMDVANKDEVVVDEVGGKYYLDSLFIQGNNRGFRFTQADALRSQLEQANQRGNTKNIPVRLSAR
jgi:hypothetical protein